MKIVTHPLRNRALRELAEGTYSPKELAIQFDLPLSNVNYHVRVLADSEAIRLVRTAQQRGSTEHFYEATELGHQLLGMLGTFDA